MKQICNWLTLRFMKLLDLPEQYAVINYAINVMVKNTVTLLNALLVVRICFGSVKDAIIFAIVFTILRPVAGGIHMDTYIKCQIVTVYMFVMSIWLLKNMTLNLLIIIAAISSIGMWIESPVIANYKKFNLSQIQRNQWIVHRILIIYWLTIGIYAETKIARIIQITIIMIYILQILEKIRNKNTRRYNSFFKQIKVKKQWQIAAIFLSVCIFICKNTVHSASAQWSYQDDIPDDIQRKFDNM